MTKPNICKEQFCSEGVQEGHYLCSEHWTRKRKGAINECLQCGVYKDAKYPYCRKCNKSQRKQKTRKYDPVRADTFDKHAALLKNDPKAEDKRLLFHEQRGKCVYCGNVYQYDELQIEHMIPKVLGGPDSIRNCQLACRHCNQAKGTMTDIEFRQKYASYLPQQERTPAQPPVDPKKFQTSALPPKPSFETSSRPKSRPPGTSASYSYYRLRSNVLEGEDSEGKNSDSAPSPRKDPKSPRPAAPPKGSVERRDEPERASPSRSEELRRKLGPVNGHEDSVSKRQLKEECQKRKRHMVAVGLLCLILVSSSVAWYVSQPSEQITTLEELEKYERARDAGLQALEDYIVQNPNSPYLDQAKDLIRTYKDEK